MIKWIVSDLDGTLLNRAGTISPGNQAALRAAFQKGARLILATGRDWTGVKAILDHCHMEAWAILGNGAQFVDEKGQILKTAYFPKARFLDVIGVFDALHIHYMIFTDRGFYATHDPQAVCDAFIARSMHRFHKTREEVTGRGPMPCMQLKKIDDVQAFLASPLEIVKVEAFSIDEAPIVEAKKRLAGMPGIAYLSSFPDNVEVTDKAAQKGLILEAVMQDAGLKKEEIMVLGDALNDLSLFERFPYSFAMGNADKLIQSLSYRVVKDCEDDGVAEAIWMMI